MISLSLGKMQQRWVSNRRKSKTSEGTEWGIRDIHGLGPGRGETDAVQLTKYIKDRLVTVFAIQLYLYTLYN
jgi:hypothetical protein